MVDEDAARIHDILGISWRQLNKTACHTRRHGPSIGRTTSKTDTVTLANREEVDGGSLRRPSALVHRVTTGRDEAKLTHRKAPQTDAIHCDRFPIRLTIPLDSEPHEHELAHITYTLERQPQRLLPHGVESIILDRTRAYRRHRSVRMYVARGCVGKGVVGGGWGEEGRGVTRVTPVGSVNGHLDVWVNAFVHDLTPRCILGPGQVLSRNDLLRNRKQPQGTHTSDDQKHGGE